MNGRFSIETNPEAEHRWDDETDGLTIECAYDIRFSPTDGHRHLVRFAPIVTLESSSPLTVDQWIDRWVTPMLRLASLATRRPQRLSWLTVRTTPTDAAGAERPQSTRGVVFGSGIEQAPYEAHYREEWRKPENRPLFTLASIPMPLPLLLRRWRELEADQNPFVELYGQALRQTDLPPRARFLYLVQALEALHGHEHAAADQEAQAKFQAARTDALDALQHVELPDGMLRFIRNNWSKRKTVSLERRLRDLISGLPARVGDTLYPPTGDPLTAQLREESRTDLPRQLQDLRNALSHGTRNYQDHTLQPWVLIAETMCRAYILRLLSFDGDAVERGLTPATTPGAPGLAEPTPSS